MFQSYLSISQSFCPQGSYVTITYDVLDLITLYSDPPLDMAPYCTRTTHPSRLTSGGQDWKHVQICSLEDAPVLTSNAIEAHTVSKWAVCILLECFLVAGVLPSQGYS